MAIINDFTLEEKVGLLSGKNTWETLDFSDHNLKSIKFSNGSNGLRICLEDDSLINQGEVLKATCYPSLSTLACSFNRDLLYRIGEAIGNEAKNQGVDIVLAPSLNVKRHPMGGKNFDYMSEDPYLNGELGVSYVTGLQSIGLGACIKEFAVNSQETYRYTYNALIDERTLREIYLEPFRKVIEKANPFAVMMASNKVNSEYCSENKTLLQDILRDEWRYDGLVISDWGATNDRIKALKAGLDLEMPTSGSYNDYLVFQAVQNNELDEKYVNDSVRRLLLTLSKLDHPVLKDFSIFDYNNLAEEAARESFVLLKNEGILPLNKNDDFMIVGKLADEVVYQGNGLSKVDPTTLVSPLFAFNKQFKDIKYFPGYSDDEIEDATYLREAIETAKKVKNVVIFVGLDSNDLSEGVDRENFTLPSKQLNLIDAIRKVNENIVIVVEGALAIDYSFENKAKAILHTSLMGQMGGRCVVEMLFGDISPCGKLCESIPYKLSDVGCDKYYLGNKNVYYAESIYVGYRYYDSYEVAPRYPFGYGLSYARFKILCDRVTASDNKLIVKCNVTNMSKYAAKEVIQVYIRNKSKRDYYAYQELKGFEKVSLSAFESKDVIIEIPIEEIKYYDVSKHSFEVESGDYEIAVGTSSRDIVKVYPLRLKGSNDYKSVQNEMSCYYKKLPFNEEDFRKLLGLRILPPLEEKTRPYTLNSTLSEIKDSVAGMTVYKLAQQEATNEDAILPSENMKKMIDYAPLRLLAIVAADRFTFDQAQGLVDVLNKKLFRGVKGLKKTERIILNGKK